MYYKRKEDRNAYTELHTAITYNACIRNALQRSLMPLKSQHSTLRKYTRSNVYVYSTYFWMFILYNCTDTFVLYFNVFDSPPFDFSYCFGTTHLVRAYELNFTRTNYYFRVGSLFLSLFVWPANTFAIGKYFPTRYITRRTK
jgi:hypothetical protein